MGKENNVKTKTPKTIESCLEEQLHSNAQSAETLFGGQPPGAFFEKSIYKEIWESIEKSQNERS